MSQASLQHSHFTLHPHTESKGRVGSGREGGSGGAKEIDRHEREQKERSMKDQNDKEGGGEKEIPWLCVENLAKIDCVYGAFKTPQIFIGQTGCDICDCLPA